MPRARKPCSVPGCPEIIEPGRSRCPAHDRQADRDRGTAAERGYNSRGHQRFRQAVLAADPVCVECRQRWSTVADHWPRSRRELIDAGLDPNDPRYGRGLCKPCHDRSTGRAQPGGWNQRS
jgi:5-methylcytosine-specific restriction protein A